MVCLHLFIFLPPINIKALSKKAIVRLRNQIKGGTTLEGFWDFSKLLLVGKINWYSIKLYNSYFGQLLKFFLNNLGQK